MDREWTSGFFKDPVVGSVEVTPTGLIGDGQADLKNHGGPDKAINAYPADYFPVWREELGVEFSAGAFGENFTTEGALEKDVCIGDVFRAGGIVVQITQPRQPCWKLARRWRIKELAARVEQTGRTGWYFRVLQTGTVQAPAELTLVERPYPQWTVAEANAVMHHRKTDWAAAAALAECAALSASWKASLMNRVETKAVASSAGRLGGNE
ncbi:MOSC domain-containing protein [Nibricoccus aquaticus]|uniref:MOSC domain-containing protein n=2 Tax=Nibricoccus aquaticus TaxID=2576891 RepID=A0A290QCF1_9BACT|nr:MOSC domain-containing protein [Nibricoccus aquaticus]